MICPAVRILPALGLAALLTGEDTRVAAQPQPGAPQSAPVRATQSELWLVPAPGDRVRNVPASTGLTAAVRQYADGDYGTALRILERVPASAALREYIEYYRGMTQLRLKQLPEASRTLQALVDRQPQGAVRLIASLGLGEAAEAAGDAGKAQQIYQRLANDKEMVTDEVLSRLGRTALAAGDRKAAAQAYVRLYYEFALSDLATAAASRLQGLQDQIVRTGYKADLGRAAMLFGARRYADARAAFQEIHKQASGDDRELVELRLAECDFYLKRYAAARDGVRPYLERASRKAEARFFYLSALRELGQHEEYVAQTRALVAAFPADSWAEEALNNLGTHYILTNDDAAAAATFAELYEKFPTGARAERAAWKAGWWSYRRGEYDAAIRTFESAVAAFPRSDYRPSFLYWSARAHARLGRGEDAAGRFRLVYNDYGNSYYGRLARRHIGRTETASATHAVPAVHQNVSTIPSRPPTADRIRLLLANALYDDALTELRFAQRLWGNSPMLEATMAWAYHQKGELRRGISLMRRAYPQSLTAGGHLLPVEMRQVIFPLAYWELIRKHSNAHDLDPFLIAALIAQESTFEPTARSVANAWGLMQVVPDTGRRLARALGIRRFTTATLTHPETNIRMGTLHFARLVRQFGGAYHALASYNAGENRVIRWKAERPGLDEDEFIDDIPFPETQNYVKRILGTAEDYRILYGRDGGRPLAVTAARP